MKNRFDYGDEVRVIRNVRNDGTYPGVEVGELLLRRGSVGCVYDVGTYLQDQVIYRVNFIEAGRTVGCRQEELVPASDPWIPNRFEFNEKVRTIRSLAVGGEVVVEPLTEGHITRVVRDDPRGVFYHVHFANGREFQVPEASLDALDESGSTDT